MLPHYNLPKYILHTVKHTVQSLALDAMSIQQKSGKPRIPHKNYKNLTTLKYFRYSFEEFEVVIAHWPNATISEDTKVAN